MSEPMHAEQVARKEFSVSFRGFDQHEVRAFLAQVAGELGAWEERERSLRARITELDRPVTPVELDEAQIEAALGQTATRIIHAAREAAGEIRAQADAESSRKLEEAEAILAKATDQATEATAALRAEAEESAASMVDDARARAAAMMVDAQAERDRTLRELADHRSTLVAELDQLSSARDRLRQAYDAAQRALDAAVHAVESAGAEAADLVARARAATPVEVEAVEVAPVEVEAVEVEAVEVQAEVVEAEPAVPEPEPEPEERRSSALKLLRPVAESRGTPTAPPVDDEYEGVRIIRPEPQPEATAVEEPDADVASEEPEPVAAEPEPEPEPVAAEPEPEPEPEPESLAVEPEPEPENETVAEDDEPADREEPVDDLFARLRADRADKVAKAEAVLAATDASPREPEPVVDEEGSDDELSPDLAVLAARDTAVADAERTVLRSLKRALADEQNEVLDALRRLRGAPTLAGLLPDVAVHDARYDAVLNGGAARAAVAGGDLAGGSGGNASGVTAEIGRAVASDLRGRVERSIEDSSGDVETLAEAISATYREWKTARAETLAREVITAAFASGTYHASTGALRWVVDPAEGGCPDCEDNVLAGPTPKGTAFPTGQLHPPAHAGCRCAVVPVS